MKAPLWFLFNVYLAASFEYKTNLWRNERQLGRGEEINRAFYTKPHYYLLWSANFSGSKERGIFYSKGEENGVSHCKRTSASFGHKMGHKSLQFLELKVCWRQARVCMYTHMYHPARESPLKCFPCYLLPSASLRIGTTPREILDVLWHFPRQIFLKLGWIFLFVGISCWVFLQCPPAALGSRLEPRFKLLQVQRCHRVQYTCSPAQLGDTLWAQLPQPHGRLKEGRSPFHKLLPDNCQLSSANTISSLIKSLIKPVSALTFIPPSICVNFCR